jgi:hypothetical protein
MGVNPQLTFEDVPPIQLGGRPLLLICKECNNPQGSALDSPAADREKIHDLLVSPDPGREMHGELTIGELRIRIRVEVEGDAFRLRIVDQHSANNPTDIAEAIRLLNELAAGQDPAPPMRFRVIPGPRSKAGIQLAPARLSWVRSAYLVAFAAFGWQYVLHPRLRLSMDRLRGALNDPAAHPLPSLALLDLDAATDRHDLIIVQEPVELRSVAVVLGRYTVFLPWQAHPRSLEDLAATLRGVASAPQDASGAVPRLPYSGKTVPWPARPRYDLDQ